MRQWQVRPELMATRRVAGAIASLSTEASTGADAAALRSELSTSTQAAQVADFPDLPILEPAIPIDAPIVVPPITARAPEPIQPAPLAEIETPEAEAVETPPIEEAVAEETSVEEAAVEEAVIEETAVALEVVAAPTSTSPVALNTMPAPTESQNESPAVVIPEIDLSDNSSSRTTNSRWPEPIPFGQPLP